MIDLSISTGLINLNFCDSLELFNVCAVKVTLTCLDLDMFKDLRCKEPNWLFLNMSKSGCI